MQLFLYVLGNIPFLFLYGFLSLFIIKRGTKLHYGQQRNEGAYCASELAGIEPTQPALEEQGMPAFAN
jgi:hypothetical protein